MVARATALADQEVFAHVTTIGAWVYLISPAIVPREFVLMILHGLIHLIKLVLVTSTPSAQTEESVIANRENVTASLDTKARAVSEQLAQMIALATVAAHIFRTCHMRLFLRTMPKAISNRSSPKPFHIISGMDPKPEAAYATLSTATSTVRSECASSALTSWIRDWI